MPVKFPKGFGRRKSTATPFEDGPEQPVVEQSFKVFERPAANKSFDGGLKFAKSANAPGVYGRSKTAPAPLEHDNMFENVMKSRGSASNSTSTADNSSRLSAASTAASSTDQVHREDRSSKDKPLEGSAPSIPKSASAFSLKNAGRTLSWGRHKQPALSSPNDPKEPTSPRYNEEQSIRTRAATASSHASTTRPPKSEKNNSGDLGLSMGGDFSDIFAGFGKRKSVVLDAEANRSMSNSPEYSQAGPANRSNQSNSRLMAPSPLSFDRKSQVEQSPYSWSSQHSNHGLISSMSPPPLADRDTPPPPPVPKHTTRTNSEPEPAAYNRPQRPDSGGLRRSSALSAKRQSTLEYGDAVDEDARLLRESINASRQMDAPTTSTRPRDGYTLPSQQSYDGPASNWKYGSADTTPKGKKVETIVHEDVDDDNMFDTSFQDAANAAQRYQETSTSSTGRTIQPAMPSAVPKVMTPAQFERYKQDQERMKSIGGQSKAGPEDDDDETYDDEEDEAEQAKAAAKIRRKQEAHMAVYRQQMMKVTGEAPDMRPAVFASHSSPNLTLGLSGGAEDPEEDEEVPLAILQAHGFPNKSKPAVMRSMGSNPNLRAAGSASGGVLPSGHLPVFARNLPQDPYYGAGLVTPAYREPMSFGGGAESINGGQSRNLPPGGLVGVIVSEEKSRAMRRGSPNPDGTYGHAPPVGYNGMLQPQPGNMYNGMGAQPNMGPMGMQPMMLSPGDAAQMQMSQQMSQFMQMQMQFMNMMTNGQGQQQQQQQANGHIQHASMGPPSRPGSAYGQGLRPGSSHQRAMTMLEPNAAPWMQNGSGSGGLFAPSIHAQGNGYAPSIAPSERSNVGLPGRYRPVSQAPPVLRATTMSGGMQENWLENKKPLGATIRAVQQSENVSDDDDEEAWAEMAKKREKKKSGWRLGKKDKDTGSSGLMDILNYAHT